MTGFLGSDHVPMEQLKAAVDCVALRRKDKIDQFVSEQVSRYPDFWRIRDDYESRFGV